MILNNFVWPSGTTCKLGHSNEMEGQSNDPLREQKNLEEKLSVMLQGVVRPEQSPAWEQCIYRVPQDFREINPKAYTPCVVAIGPFHKPCGFVGENSNLKPMEEVMLTYLKESLNRNNNILEPMEEVKLKYLKGFLYRNEELRMGDLVHKLKDMETRIRSCYAEPIHYNSDDFLKMILIDACFIIEHFLRHRTYRDWIAAKDPILSKNALWNNVQYDLILLENQLPFFVLEEIYNLAGMNQNFNSFIEITFHYFEAFNRQNIDTNEVNPKPKHFTDLLRTFMLPSSSINLGEPEQRSEIEHVYSASQLSEAGLEFVGANERKCLLDLDYQKGVLKIPCLELDDGTETLFRNVVAFEQCHNDLHPPSITQYFFILDFLINNEKDVNILVDKKIIVNFMGDANAVATMVNSLCKNAIFPSMINSRFLNICKGLNRFCESPYNKNRAIFLREYFNTPWKKASTIAATMLLLLTLIQTICSIISLF